MDLMSAIAVGTGAALGALLRWWLGAMFNPLFPTIPMGTLAANWLGGFIMGIAMGLIANYQALSPELRLFLTTGFLGGLTTFSTFSAETVTLFLRTQYGWAFAAILMHVAGSLAMTLLGFYSYRLIRL
ncbi:MAG: fluoride efflux transporter CrcB [Stenotrophobium sp.]